MASPFKIPKKKQAAGSDSAHLHMPSPLSRLQSPAPEFKSYGGQPSRGGADRMHAGNALGSSTNRQSAPCKPNFRDMVKMQLGINSPNRGVLAANHRASGGWSRQSQPGQRAESSSACFSNRWRPKRASDRLLQPDGTAEPPSPPQKKRSDLSGSSSSARSVSVEAPDTLAELRGEEHAGSLSSSTPGKRTWRRVESGGGAAEGKSDAGSSPESLKQQKKNSSLAASDPTSEDDFVSPSRTRNEDVRRPSASPRTMPGRRRSLDRMSWLAASGDLREEERERWRAFRERKTSHLQRKPKHAPAEPIVLSSEEEEEGEDDADGGKSSSRVEEQLQVDEPAPSFLQLDFASLHAGLTHADANGKMMVSINTFSGAFAAKRRLLDVSAFLPNFKTFT